MAILPLFCIFSALLDRMYNHTVCSKLVNPIRNLTLVSVFSLSLVTHNRNPNILRLGQSGT